MDISFVLSVTNLPTSTLELESLFAPVLLVKVLRISEAACMSNRLEGCVHRLARSDVGRGEDPLSENGNSCSMSLSSRRDEQRSLFPPAASKPP